MLKKTHRRLSLLAPLLSLFFIHTAFASPTTHFTELQSKDNTRLSQSPFIHSKEKNNGKFEFIEGQEIGLDKGFMYGLRDYTDPFWIGRGTASGDYDKDGWQDIIFGSNHGFVLYRNTGGKFKQQQLNNKTIKQQQVYAVAFVDLDNDGWLDIFYTTFDKGNFLILNKQGDFDSDNLISVPNNNAALTLSPAFADIDYDGYPDIVNGNIGLGVVTGSHYMRARRNNSIVFNGGLKFRDVVMEKTSGETMASLISDINNDDIADIYFGNDFFIPDKLLLGTGAGFKPVGGNRFIPYTPFFSMGADSGDINNDLDLDFVVMGTMETALNIGKNTIDEKLPVEYTRYKGDAKTCEQIKHPDYRKNCIDVRQTNYVDILDRQQAVYFTQCRTENTAIEKELCLTRVMWQLITQNPDINNCKTHFADDKKLQTVCDILKLRDKEFDRRNIYGAIPQDDRNMLYTYNKNAKSLEMVKGFKHPGGWTWSSRIADLDNDGWQDIFNSEGAVRKHGYGWNVFMKNIDGQHFEQKQFSYGLTNDFGLYSFSLVDMDNDGDLDIIGNGAEGPVQVYKNKATKNNHSIAISLIDSKGNYNAIGAKVFIYYDKKQKAQMREIKASGGYQSFDTAMAWFGLGSETKIDEIHVLWPDQSSSTFSGPLKSDMHYRIER